MPNKKTLNNIFNLWGTAKSQDGRVIPASILHIEEQIQNEIDATIIKLVDTSIRLTLDEIRKNKSLYIGLMVEENGSVFEPIDDMSYRRQLTSFNDRSTNISISVSNADRLVFNFSIARKVIGFSYHLDSMSQASLNKALFYLSTKVPDGGHLIISRNHLEIKSKYVAIPNNTSPSDNMLFPRYATK
jgi:hypothetical protein